MLTVKKMFSSYTVLVLVSSALKSGLSTGRCDSCAPCTWADWSVCSEQTKSDYTRDRRLFCPEDIFDRLNASGNATSEACARECIAHGYGNISTSDLDSMIEICNTTGKSKNTLCNKAKVILIREK